MTWLKINFGQWPDHVDRPNKCLRCHVSTFLTGQNKERKLTLDSPQAQNYQLLGLVVAEPFKVAEHSFSSLWVCVIYQIKARERLQLTSWNLASKKYTDERVWLTGQMWRFRGFHCNMNDWLQPVTCLPPRSVNCAALPLARLDLSHSAKNWYDFTTQYYRYLSLPAFLFLLLLSHNVFKKKRRKEKSNKLQNGLIEEVARFHSNAGDEWKRHPPRPCTWLI